MQGSSSGWGWKGRRLQWLHYKLGGRTLASWNSVPGDVFLAGVRESENVCCLCQNWGACKLDPTTAVGEGCCSQGTEHPLGDWCFQEQEVLSFSTRTPVSISASEIPFLKEGRCQWWKVVDRTGAPRNVKSDLPLDDRNEMFLNTVLLSLPKGYEGFYDS